MYLEKCSNLAVLNALASKTISLCLAKLVHKTLACDMLTDQRYQEILVTASQDANSQKRPLTHESFYRRNSYSIPN